MQLAIERRMVSHLAFQKALAAVRALALVSEFNRHRQDELELPSCTLYYRLVSLFVSHAHDVYIGGFAFIQCLFYSRFSRPSIFRFF